MRAWRPRCPARREDTCCTLERERVWSAPLDRMMMASSVLDWNWPWKDFLLLTTTRTCCPRLSCLRLFHAGFWAPQSEELTSRPRSGSTTRRQNGRTANLLFRTHRSYTHSAPFFRQPESSILNCCKIAISLIYPQAGDLSAMACLHQLGCGILCPVASYVFVSDLFRNPSCDHNGRRPLPSAGSSFH